MSFLDIKKIMTTENKNVKPVNYILRDNLIQALAIAIDAREEPYGDFESAFVAGLRQSLAGLQLGGNFEVRE